MVFNPIPKTSLVLHLALQPFRQTKQQILKNANAIAYLRTMLVHNIAIGFV